ncbi:VPLPA-CTERM sorting domain-containing protein [Aliishimia ponticola]|uniref:VPLPA-CTERM sorting domain-containing protein n=1 Tax=Aliishimia ponticola TaxID=2499833 RepID=A0A4S4NA61_9RHOB|nr:VPLPA-CTERM sorting domain-containing protein [Aliishimia ponticola]THH36089.1 VPLPA-CTERM sorting domain-containing protein [Aliishimia ponticola]
MRTILTALALSLTAGAVSAATIENGSFEDLGSNSLGGSSWKIFSDLPGWTGVPNLELQTNATLSSIDAQDGSNYVELASNQNAAIEQSVSLTAGTYALSFWYSPRINGANTSTNDMSYVATSRAGDIFSGVINGAPDPLFPHGVWTQVTETFTLADDALVTFTFAATGVGGSNQTGALIDNVSLAAVPLPASGALLLGGVAAMGAVRRRARRA